MTNAEQVSAITGAFRDGLQGILGKKLHGLYIYGAAAFPDGGPTLDIDFHVILNDPLTEKERSDLRALHESLAQQFPPLGAELDGYYILLRDARRRILPRSQLWSGATDDSWALHREHIRAGRCLVVYGPDPRGIYPPATWSELEHALIGELLYVQKHMQGHPAYCVLNLCRLIYSFETRNVAVSKATTADWARQAFPEWQGLIGLARKSYAQPVTTEERQQMLAGVGRLFQFALARIREATTGVRSGRTNQTSQGLP
jgi:hypothetical protein